MNRRGLTLIEMLVALAATLLMMAAVTQAFQSFGGAISSSRAVLDLDARMRSVAWRLRSDLAGATARLLPPAQAEAGEGYFEIIEGPVTDAVTAGTPVGPTDHDDALLFTARNTETPFIGRAPTVSSTATALIDTFESTLAEVAWFARMTPGSTNPVTYTLYRKQLLVMGYMGSDPFTTGSNNTRPFSGSWSAYFNLPSDVSARREGSTLLPNTIADLTRRESRFMHNPNGVTDVSGFPFAFVLHQAATAPDGLIFDTDQRRGEDIVLTNVLSFDVRVFDPAAPVSASPSGVVPLVPGDSGAGTAVGSGAYVDLGNGVTTNALVSSQGVAPRFAGDGATRSKLDFATDGRRTYDTWSNHYEANGRDEDNDGVVDDANDGLDNDGNGTIDDASELETSAPYPWPLRGIEVRIRCYEPSSRQVRQVTVRHTFVPH